MFAYFASNELYFNINIIFNIFLIIKTCHLFNCKYYMFVLTNNIKKIVYFDKNISVQLKNIT